MDALPAEVKEAADHLAVDGMSATALLVDGRTGAQLAAPMLYNESQPAEVVAAVKVPDPNPSQKSSFNPDPDPTPDPDPNCRR